MDKNKNKNNQGGKPNLNKGKKITGYVNGPLKPYMGTDGYLHCAYCRLRYEPGHRCKHAYK